MAEWLVMIRRWWMSLSSALGKLVSPVVMGAFYFLVFCPIALVQRLTGKTLLQLRRDPAAKTYWIMRNPPGPAPETMKNQF